jgi:pimeloyl-ACP methyl ester carboxylesterase
MSVPSVPDLPSAGTGPIPAGPGAAAEGNTIRPFRIDIPEDEVAELRLRVAATRWPHRETVTDRSQGAQLMLDDISLYWFTHTETSSARLYWENSANNFNAVDIFLPAAVTVFPGEIYRVPRSWTQRCYHQLIYFHEVDRGGHFAAWEEPELFAAEVRAAFRSLR